MIKKQLNENGELTVDQIYDIVKNTDVSKFDENLDYFSGNNPTILDKEDPDNDHYPNNKVPVPYARKIALTTKNYMFVKPVQYNADDDAHMAAVNDVLDINKNHEKISVIGENMVIYGVAYKLFYFDNLRVKYAIPSPVEMYPVYSWDVEPRLISAIRYYVGPDEYLYFDVYYQTELVRYRCNEKTLVKEKIVEIDRAPHGFASVPLVVYGDTHQLGVFDPIKKMLDAIDNLVSTELNEIDKFEFAYMIISGANIHEKDLEKTNENRIIALPENTTINYLIKDMQPEFLKYFTEFLVNQVHEQSSVPDFDDKDFAAESGVALRYKLMGFENMASNIEKIFTSGEQDSFDLINQAIYNIINYDGHDFYKQFPGRTIQITMHRNIPENLMENIQVATALKALGVSMETVLDNVELISDTAGELEKIGAEKQDNMDRVMQYQQGLTTEPRDESPDEEE